MEPAKISPTQLFVLILLFELGSALLYPIGTDANQNAWLAILIAMVGGFAIFLIHYALYSYYPDQLPTTYTQKILGKFFGKIASFLFMLFIMYLAARALRDFGEMLAIIGYPRTPLIINHFILILVAIYAVRKGIEVIGRTGEILFAFIYILAIFGFIFIIASDLIHLNNLKPFLEDGILPVIKVAFTHVVFFPFGEVFVYAMIFPYVNKPKKIKKAGLLALLLIGINLAISTAINISVLGYTKIERTQFPLLNTIQAIEIAEFLQRLDIFFMLSIIILGFFKVAIYFYVVVIGVADLFKVKESSQLAVPLAFVIIFLSIVVANNSLEHIAEAKKISSIYVQFPFQVLIPTFLLLIAFFKKRKQNRLANDTKT
ncbi:GerAB/ArcD/ProY family transporter [Lederbergia galactosidilytica]|uniref:Spore gernimation protein KB n=1 Tax=Lederbergia galactosidilytica TaxID=217031 RepID=A0A0Q9XWB6_9BACI|nr:GerAB/ArcD/ProY family transporter [Lederbergia galactosidilytica]KRG12733.1 spore gernimation protein KB [Lederbergia galactosidilytica]OAK73866.1 spore gernimation protein KB [Lederbergia galactosidilytica]